MTRDETTEHAIEMIDFNLDKGYLGAAVVVASNYVQLRLGSLLADHYLPKKHGKKWVGMATLFRETYPHVLLERCQEFEIIDQTESNILKQLFNIRNNAAHKTDLWHKPKVKEKGLRTQATQLCNQAKDFLEQTSQTD